MDDASGMGRTSSEVASHPELPYLAALTRQSARSDGTTITGHDA
jgi:hypothetical protein